MVNSDLSLKINEELIKDLTILKLKKNFGLISIEQYDEEVIDIASSYDCTDFTYTLSKIAFDEVLKQVEDMEDKDEVVKVLIKEKLTIYCDGAAIPVTADVILLSKESIEIIDIRSFDYDFIYPSQEIEIKLLGLAAIDKFLTRITSDKIRLTIVQPNLMATSVYETDIMSLLHECEYNLV